LRVLIAAPASTDTVVTGRASYSRPGGPALYAGGAAALLGHEVYAYGGWGHENLCTIRAERAMGVERFSLPSPGPGAVLMLDYTMPGRRVAIKSPPPRVCTGLLRAVRILRPDLVIVSSIHGDICPQVLPLVRHHATTVLDVQGYHRAGMKSLIPGGAADAIHATGREAQGIPGGAAPVIVETSGYGPVRMIKAEGETLLLDKPPGPRLEDPTGAGDVFTLLLALGLARGMSPEEAALSAAGLVHAILGEVHRRVEHAGCPGV